MKTTVVLDRSDNDARVRLCVFRAILSLFLPLPLSLLGCE